MSDALINGLAGAGGGIIAQLITYPLQTVNTRQQTERDLKKEKRKLGTIEQLCQVVKQEGWERLYGGLMPSLVGTAASQGVYYYFYQIFKNRAEATALELKRRGIGDGSVGMFSSLVVAAVAGYIHITHSKISKKSISQSNQPLSPAPDGTVLSVVELISYGTSHVVSNPSIQFMLYETMLKKLKKRRSLLKQGNNGVTALELWQNLGASVVTYPLLVVKPRLQAKQVTTGDKRHHYKDAILKMIHYEGFSGFYKGMSTKIVQSVLVAAVLFMVKEELVRVARFLLTPSKVKSKPP